jgi:hypothetical protein
MIYRKIFSPIDKEALGIVWSVRKFSPSRAIPATTAARLQRYAIFLSGFNYDIEYSQASRGIRLLPSPKGDASHANLIESAGS